MYGYLVWSLGVFSVAFWPQLPGISFSVLCVLAGVLLLAINKFRLIGWFLLGIAFALAQGHWSLSERLPAALDKVDVDVTGRVVGLPVAYRDRTRFYFQIEQFAEPSEFAKAPYFSNQRRVLLSWYYPDHQLRPGQELQFRARLRFPRGSSNPGGFDYQLWLLRKGVTATGYVREMFDSPEPNSSRELINSPERVFSPGLFVDQLRYKLRESIAHLPMPDEPKALITALTIGDKQLLSSADWQRYAGAGVVHLLVISGLHIGFASLLGYWLGLFFGRLVNLTGDRVFAPRWGALLAMLAAGFYASLAGWSIPTQRAFVMVLVVVLANLSYRYIAKGLGFFVAIAAVATLDPLAVLDKGFWLSFVAVAILLWLVPASPLSSTSESSALESKTSGPPSTSTLIDDSSSKTKRLLQVWLRSLPGQLYYFFKIQLIVCVLLAALLFIMQLPVSLLGPLVNMVAIPWVSLLVVPLCLLGAFGLLFSGSVAEFFWQLAGIQLQWFSRGVDWVTAGQQALTAFVPDLAAPTSLVAQGAWLVSVLMLLLPFGRLIRVLGAIAFLTLLLSKPEAPALQVTVLDVGQGLSVVVQTPNHSLVYDTGAVFNERLNAGSAIVAPFLASQGINHLNKVIVSHNDNDHAGGLISILDSLPVEAVIVGQPLKPLVGQQTIAGNTLASTLIENSPCLHRQSWQWEGVDFMLINPSGLTSGEGAGKQVVQTKDNNLSCILLVSFSGTTILLPGDIEKQIEPALISFLDKQLPMSILVAPHHGSRTSSTAGFVDAIAPQYVVFSAGFNHHFRHPNVDVVKRYQQAGSQLLNTADKGAIGFVWNHDKSMDLRLYRDDNRRYWH